MIYWLITDWLIDLTQVLEFLFFMMRSNRPYKSRHEKFYIKTFRIARDSDRVLSILRIFLRRGRNFNESIIC